MRRVVAGALHSRLPRTGVHISSNTFGMDSHWAPASWLIGPPAPRGLLYVRLGLQLTVLGLVLTWVFAHLGGLALGPTTVSETANDTGRLFNWWDRDTAGVHPGDVWATSHSWAPSRLAPLNCTLRSLLRSPVPPPRRHPLLMTLAFPLLMGEALSSYKRPAIGARLKDRSHKKLVHFALQSAASACVVAGFVAVLKSHTLKKPEPMANFYSPHSYLGLAVFALLGLQYGLGFWAYLAPKLSLSNRQALGPVHAFLGQATFILGLATMMVSRQQAACVSPSGPTDSFRMHLTTAPCAPALPLPGRHPGEGDIPPGVRKGRRVHGALPPGRGAAAGAGLHRHGSHVRLCPLAHPAAGGSGGAAGRSCQQRQQRAADGQRGDAPLCPRQPVRHELGECWVAV